MGRYSSVVIRRSFQRNSFHQYSILLNLLVLLLLLLLDLACDDNQAQKIESMTSSRPHMMYIPSFFYFLSLSLSLSLSVSHSLSVFLPLLQNEIVF